MQNCWEFKKCGRETNGAKVAELGVCPATTDESTDGLNSGKNGGRICWAVTGTFCGNKVQGSFAEKRVSCMTCDFFSEVKKTIGREFSIVKAGPNLPKTFVKNNSG